MFRRDDPGIVKQSTASSVKGRITVRPPRVPQISAECHCIFAAQRAQVLDWAVFPGGCARSICIWQAQLKNHRVVIGILVPWSEYIVRAVMGFEYATPVLRPTAAARRLFRFELQCRW